MKIIRIALPIVLGLLYLAPQLSAQYFGRNKPRYEKFDFEVLNSPTFEIYHYLENPEVLKALSSSCEHWYHAHQEVLSDTFNHKNPVIFYNNHPDFQQTTAVSSSISIGTGGVTEGLKNRVILPLAMSNQQTDHVLGHELVHAFQYHMIINGDSTSIKNLANIPLWMIEGLAEYMSIGRVDAHTSMWMRDAILNDKVPSLKDLSKPEFFPYRYGQAFWAFVTGLHGDQIVAPLFVSTAKYGLEKAIEKELKTNFKDFSDLWQKSLIHNYEPFLGNKKERFVGRKVISDENAGNMNISPVLSPNGRYVIFLSEKNLFSVDIFLADARTGKVMRKVASTTKDGHLDDFNFIESAGTWSPRSDKFAFVAVRQGNNILVIKEALTGKTIEEFGISGVPAFSNPAWSPDGKSIVVSGLVNGQVDLFEVRLKNKKITQLTNDRYSEMQASWSKDGANLVFATDQLSIERGKVNGKWTFNLAIMDILTKKIEVLDFFYGADNLNPVFDIDNNLLFLSNRDGFRNLYKYDISSGKIFQQTEFLTGISGITQYSPAITTALKSKHNRVLFTHYFNNGYNIYRAKQADFLNKEVDVNGVDMAAATLPKVNRNAPEIVADNLANLEKQSELSDSAMVAAPYRPKFKLDYIGGGTGVGVGTNRSFGTQTGLQGGVDMLFGDILGSNQIYSSLFLNGEIYDFGGAVSYINQKNRIGWGLTLSHTPHRDGRFGYVGRENLTIGEGTTIPVDHFVEDRIRYFEEKVGAFAQFPFSKTLRLEAGAAYSFYNNRVERIDYYYDEFGRLIKQDREKVEPGAVGLNLFSGQLASVNAALVGDNSYFGIASPLHGHRLRLGVEQYFGDFSFYNVTADFRKYVYLKPISLAIRGMHIGRYGKDANRFIPQYLGYPWHVRGYEQNQATDNLDLIGSKILVSNFEIRLPFTGPEKLSAFKSKFLFTELSLFADAGLAWNNLDQFNKTDEEGNPNLNRPNPLFSVGASLRINLFGALILEPYYAIPFQKEMKGVFGLNIVPGW